MDEEMFTEGYESSPMVLGTELDVEDDEYISAVERSLLGLRLTTRLKSDPPTRPISTETKLHSLLRVVEP